MDNYYTILGIEQTASIDDIKKAYKSLANKHHPDKGGDEELFKKISVAYDTLKDETKRQEYDDKLTGKTSNFYGFDGDFSSFFSDHIRSTFFRNKDITIQCRISFEESFNGKQLNAKYTLPSGKLQEIAINIPSGIQSGSHIRFPNFGDDSVAEFPRGHLNVTVLVEPSDKFFRKENDLCTLLHVTPIEAMIGCEKTVNHINGQQFTINIRPGVETGIEYAMLNKGFSNPYNNNIGRFLIIVNIKTPAITDPELVEELTKINSRINTNI